MNLKAERKHSDRAIDEWIYALNEGIASEKLTRLALKQIKKNYIKRTGDKDYYWGLTLTKTEEKKKRGKR